MIIKGDKSNLAEECGVKLFEQGVRIKECQHTCIDTAKLCFKCFKILIFTDLSGICHKPIR